MRTSCLVVIALVATLLPSLPASAGLFDRTGDEGTFMLQIPKPTGTEFRPSRVGGTLAVMEFENARHRFPPNASYEGYKFDLSGLGSFLAEIFGDDFAEAKVFGRVLEVDRSVLVRYDLPTLAKREKIDAFLGGEIVEATLDVASKSALKVSVATPRVTLTVRVWMKDAVGKEVWAAEVKAAETAPGLEGLSAFDKSETNTRIRAQLAELGDKKPSPMRVQEFYFAETASSLVGKAVGAIHSKAITGLKEAWEAARPKMAVSAEAVAGAPAAGGAESNGSVERKKLREFRDVMVHIRGRKWEGEQGLLRDRKVTSKVKKDQTTYRIACDGEIVDEGIFSSYRTDSHGSWSKDTFNAFEETFPLSLPLGKRTLILFLDQPDLEVEIAKSSEAATPVQSGAARGRSSKSERTGWSGLVRKLNRSVESKGVILREVEVVEGPAAHLSILRNVYVFQEKRGGMGNGLFDLLDLGLRGSGKNYFGSWEASYRDHDPFEYLANIDWKKPSLQDLLSPEASKRKKACKALQANPMAEAGPALVETISLDSDDNVREEAIKALIRLDDPATAYFVVRAMVWDTEEDNRERCMKYLVKGKKVAAVPYLEEYYFASGAQRPGINEKSYRKPIREALEGITGKKYPKMYSWWE